MANFEKLLENKEFTDALAMTETNEQVIKVFSDYGIAISEEELEKAVAAVSQKGDELNEAALENVAGGYAGIISGLILLGDKLGTWKWWRKRLGM